MEDKDLPTMKLLRHIGLAFPLFLLMTSVVVTPLSIGPQRREEGVEVGSEPESSLQKDASESKPEGKFLLGLIDYIFTPTRLTRNIVRWANDGVLFAGMIVQADAFVRAIYQRRERERKRQEELNTSRRSEWALRRNYDPDLSQEKDLEEEEAGSHWGEWWEGGTANRIFESPKLQPSSKYKNFQRRNFNNKLGSKGSKFFSRKGEIGLEPKLLDLEEESCIKKALCQLLKLSRLSSHVRNLVLDLRKNENFKYLSDLEGLSRMQDCEASFSTCAKTTSKILELVL